jgi:hypothetical protein
MGAAFARPVGKGLNFVPNRIKKCAFQPQVRRNDAVPLGKVEMNISLIPGNMSHVGSCFRRSLARSPWLDKLQWAGLMRRQDADLY